MRIRTIIWGLSLVSIACWLALILTVVNTNPEQGGQAALLSFYISLYVGLAGSLTLLGYATRRYLGNNELRYGYLMVAFRQAFLGAALVVGVLALQSIRLLAWWDILLLVAVVLLLELYLRSNARARI